MSQNNLPIKASLIISTYNWPEALTLCLKSISEQVELPYEVVIADDGSTPETKAVIDEWAKKIACPVHHVWQEDEGFQLAKIRNKAIAKASGDYIVSIDGDMILAPHFIQDHIRAAKKGTFVQGGRVGIGEKKAKDMLLKQDTKLHFFSHDIGNRKNTLRLPWLSTLLAKTETTDMDRIRGCNQAFWRDQLIEVNGFNEAMTGWGREDTDIFARLITAGFKRRNLKFSGLAYHIYHKENDRSSLEKNHQLLEETIKNKLIKCEMGIDQHL